MNIDLPPQRHRMVRDGRFKLVHYDGHAPTLHDLEDDPDELCDLADDPSLSDVRERLHARVLRGWDPGRIEAEMGIAAARSAMIRQWVRATCPPEPMRWRDPDPSRNRYE